MLLKRQNHRATPRRGVILMVVLAMLTLFAIVGIAFVLFSDATAMSSRISREAETQIRPDMDPEMAMSFFLGRMIYDVHDDETGVQCALRGYSFGRTVYGANFTAAAGAKWTGDNSLPYSGMGRFHQTGDIFPGVDDFNLVNYVYNKNDGIVRDPEHLGTRASPAAAYGVANPYIACNAPYTYCDGNSMFMAYMDTSTGQILTPSFHRPGLGFGTLDPSNAKWQKVYTNPPTNTIEDKSVKYQVLRPRPADHPNFPPTLDAGGDVKNLDWAPGGCDSIWIDIGAPVQVMADGRKYKMLVAPLILDLDGKLNLNVIGNILGTNNAHASNQGWGAWEMNPSKVLNSTVSPNEWQNLFVGSGYPTIQTPIQETNNWGRYGANGTPDGAGPPGGTFLHNYAQIDFNGINDKGQPGYQQATSPYLLAGAGNNPNKPWNLFPYFPTAGFGDGVPTETTPYHPSAYNPLRASGVAGDDDRRLSVQSMHALLRYGGTGSEFVTTDLRLLAQNLARDATAVQRRLQVTSLSMDLDRPGALPYVWDPNDSATQLTLAAATATKAPQPTGAPIPFPKLTSRTTPPAPFPAGSEFDPNTWRAVSAKLGRVNLNRKLTDYPALDATTGLFKLTTPAIQAQYNAAISDRQLLAKDIFTALCQATGGLDGATARKKYGVTTTAYQASRYLAQLAVNIVDYIDEDDYMTAWQWDPPNPAATPPDAGNTTAGDNGWVFGVELPRLVLNEAYAQVDNDNADQQIQPPAKPHRYVTAGHAPNLNVWVELHNPLPTETNPGQHTHSNPNAQLVLDYSNIVAAPNGAKEAGNVVTITTTAAHGFVVGQQIVICGVGVAGYNGTFAITGVPNPTTFRYTNTTVGLTPSGGGIAHPLPPYEVVLAPSGLFAGALSKVENVTGDPTFGGATTYSTSNSWGSQPVQLTVPPASGAYSSSNLSNTGFYVLGAQPAAGYDNAADNPNISAAYLSPQMSCKVAVADAGPMPGVAVALRRLACPHLPAQPNSPGTAAKPYNPYITTDVLELTGKNPQQVYDAREYITGKAAASKNDQNNTVAKGGFGHQAMTLRHSWGRLQPYAAKPALQSQNPNPVTAGQPHHTFYRHNATANAAPATIAAGDTLKMSFDWLTHLDRQLISPMELINASGVKPHEVTHYFQMNSTQTASDNPSKHLVPWTDQTGTTSSTRLSRFFEFVSTPNRSNGVAFGGRVPGKLNINTLSASDTAILRAAVDVQPGNTFFYPPPIAIITAKEAAKKVTITTATAHNLVAGEVVTIYGVGVAGYNGTFTVAAASPTPTTFTFTDPTGGLAPSGGGFVRPNVVTTIAASPNGASQAAGHVVTIRTTAPHGFTVGQSVVVANVGVAGYNGSFTITAVPSTTTFRYVDNANPTGALLPPSGSLPPPAGPGVASVSDSTVIDPILFAMINRRTPGGVPGATATDNPYMSLATGLSTGNDPASTIARGVDLTVLRPSTAGAGWTAQRMIEAPNSPGATGNSYQRYEMLNKIYNNLTVRSNVFAVWMTVGFFAVEDDTKMPVVLGAEIGHSENRHIRHRMFAIVDRTNLQLQWNGGGINAGARLTTAIAAPAGNQSYVEARINFPALTAAQKTDPRTNLQWNVAAGTILVVDPNKDNEETATLYTGTVAPNIGRLVGKFTKAHAVNAPFTVRANPGPWPGYNPRLDTAVVPYFAIID